MRILIVDRNSDVRQSLKMLLERAGYGVAVAMNAERALTAQRDCPADVLLADTLMSEEDGLEAIQRFREGFPAVKIIAMSGGDEDVVGAHGLSTASAGSAGSADVLLRKPFEVNALIRVLQGMPAAS